MTITLENPVGRDVPRMVDGALDESAERFDRTAAFARTILTPEQMKDMEHYLLERFEERETAARAATALLPRRFRTDG